MKSVKHYFMFFDKNCQTIFIKPEIDKIIQLHLNMAIKMKKEIMTLIMVCLMIGTVFGALSGNAISMSEDSFNSSVITDKNDKYVDQNVNDIENKMTIEEVRELAYEEVSKIEDMQLKSQLSSELDNAFSTLESIGVTLDMTIAQAIDIVESTTNPSRIITKPPFYTTPAVMFGPILFASIDADFEDDEGYIAKNGRRLRVDFTPNDVTSDDSYVKIKGMGATFNFPFNLPDWPVQRFNTFIQIFFGSATSSNGHIVVKGFCIYTIILAEWHRH